MRRSPLIIIIFAILGVKAEAQELSSSLLDLSLEELMRVKIVSASKKAEDNFEAPLSSSVISQEQILNAGATTIPEALRLLPGVIVREQANGVYDVHLRGLDYLPPNSEFVNSTNNSTLVMINNRIVFRDFQGGTYWESLPVDVQDIERIEVVRGATSALYGPNAASGVINIITKNPEGYIEGVSGTGSAAYGSFNTLISNARVQWKKEEWALSISHHHHHRDRASDLYYDYVRQGYVVPDSVLSANRGTYAYTPDQVDVRYPRVNRAMEKSSTVAEVSYLNNAGFSNHLTLGIHHSDVQKIYVDNQNTPFTSEASETKFIDFRSSFRGLDLQLNGVSGQQNTLGIPGWNLDFGNFNGTLEYHKRLFNKVLEIRPGVLYRSVYFDDAPSENEGGGFIGGRKWLTTFSGYLQADFQPFEKLRLIAAIRAEQYNFPDELYPSYQLSLNWRPHENHLLRAVHSRANRGPNILDTYIDFDAFGGAFQFRGNQALELMTVKSVEVGYRGKFSPRFRVDAEGFFTRATNFSAMLIDSIFFFPSLLIYNSVNEVPMTVEQRGGTLHTTFLVSDKFQVEGFLTLQSTSLNGYDALYREPGEDSLVTTSHDWTPPFYGGVLMTRRFLENKFVANVHLVYTGAQEFMHFLGTDELSTKLFGNITVRYQVSHEVEANLRIQNLGTGGDRQFAFADPVKTRVLFGVRLRLN